MKYYVYTYTDPRNNEVIYVGKGQGYRSKQHLSEFHLKSGNMLKNNKILKIKKEGLEPIIEKVLITENEQEAFDREVELIAKVGRKDLGQGPLLNLTNGGEGSAGMKHSEESKRKISNANRGNVCSEEQKQAISKANKGRKQSKEERIKRAKSLRGHAVSKETKEKISKANSGEKNGMYGTQHTVEARKLISQSKIGEKNHMYGKIQSASAKSKMGAAAKGRKRVYRDDGTYYMMKPEVI